MSVESMISLEDYANDWLSRKRKLKETTRTTYKKCLVQYIIPDLGQKTLNSITAKDIQTMLDKHKSLSAKTLTEMKSILSQIFKYAISDELVTKNPCSNMDIKIPAEKRSVRLALPIEQHKG